jgi:hypothetical protein
MNERPTFAIGAMTVGLAALCCGLPLLIVGLGAMGISAWLAARAPVVVLVLLAGTGLAWFWFVHRRKAAGYCEPEAERLEYEKKDIAP